MTGVTNFNNLIKSFDSFYINNYNKLVFEARSITQHYDYHEDIVQDCYIKMRNRIGLSGFTSINFHGYLWLSIMNEWKVLCNRNKIRSFHSISDAELDVHTINHAEEKLQESNNFHDNQQQYYEQIEYIVMMLFKYVQIRYDDKQSYLFISYFLLNDTYRTLSERTGYSISYISSVIMPIKKDLKANFKTFLKHNTLYERRRSH